MGKKQFSGEETVSVGGGYRFMDEGNRGIVLWWRGIGEETGLRGIGVELERSSEVAGVIWFGVAGDDIWFGDDGVEGIG
ncbi:putative Xylem serine proteinase 1 precursor [Corchorus olitorius]|uniref:Xylem serine proteinase 1 n=1 Tax=Corchorus olitorius TaxID=93759 RepID=A0A1R3KPM6_9ROSI|nr:putative Xylem serine proteinase 1 precursor [Corchorus olitorius]